MYVFVRFWGVDNRLVVLAIYRLNVSGRWAGGGWWRQSVSQLLAWGIYFAMFLFFVYLFGLLLRGELIMWWREGAEDRRTS